MAPTDAVGGPEAVRPSGGGSADKASAADSGWSELVARARSPLPPGSHAALDRALEEFAPFVADVPQGLEQRGEEATDAGQEPLAPEVLAALEDLRTWQREGGGLDTQACSSPRVLSIRSLARLALARSAPAADDPDLRAVLYLAHRLREEGATLVQVMLGTAIADEAVRRTGGAAWARELLAAHAPTPGHLLRALAAEAVCGVRTVERTLGPEGDTLRAGLADGRGLTSPEAQAAFLREEIEAVRSYYVELFEGARERWGDFDRVEEFLDDRADRVNITAEDHPMLALIAVHLGRRIRELSEAQDRYLDALRSP